MKKSSPQTDPALSAPKSESQTPAMPSLVEIEKPIYGGAFLARVEGKAVFIPLTLPGEQVRIRITQDKRGYTTAEAKEIITPAADRVVPACPHFAVCGGCQYQHAAPQAQLAFKEAILRETLERGGVPVPETIDVKAIRTKLAMTQEEFAGRFGFSVNTLRHWEQGLRQPEGPTRAYLMVIDRAPKAVQKALQAA